jgi:hypothetical protein
MYKQKAARQYVSRLYSVDVLFALLSNRQYIVRDTMIVWWPVYCPLTLLQFLSLAIFIFIWWPDVIIKMKNVYIKISFKCCPIVIQQRCWSTYFAILADVITTIRDMPYITYVFQLNCFSNAIKKQIWM